MKKREAGNVDFARLPSHVAIIMDGNRRYARARLLPTKAGHAAGAQNLRKLAGRMDALGFRAATVFAFAIKNWAREADEVRDLMNLFKEYIRQYIAESGGNNVRVRVIGDIGGLDAELRAEVARLHEATAAHTGLALNLAINYGGRDEILRAARRALAEGVAPGDLDEDRLSSYMDAADLPEPDLLIRTGGEQRLSDFLLWQMADTELYFCDKLWPEFNEEDLLAAVADYQRRERKFGK